MGLDNWMRFGFTYLYALVSSDSIPIPHARYAIWFFVEENYVGYVPHFGAFFSYVFFDVEDGGRVFLQNREEITMFKVRWEKQGFTRTSSSCRVNICLSMTTLSQRELVSCRV